MLLKSISRGFWIAAVASVACGDSATPSSPVGQHDAGPDASVPDAGSDSGAPDSGSDAGSLDAGPDGGEPDAGTPDAGPLDGGVTDVDPRLIIQSVDASSGIIGVFDGSVSFSLSRVDATHRQAVFTSTTSTARASQNATTASFLIDDAAATPTLTVGGVTWSPPATLPPEQRIQVSAALNGPLGVAILSAAAHLWWKTPQVRAAVYRFVAIQMYQYLAQYYDSAKKALTQPPDTISQTCDLSCDLMSPDAAFGCVSDSTPKIDVFILNGLPPSCDPGAVPVSIDDPTDCYGACGRGCEFCKEVEVICAAEDARFGSSPQDGDKTTSRPRSCLDPSVAPLYPVELDDSAVTCSPTAGHETISKWKLCSTHPACFQHDECLGHDSGLVNLFTCNRLGLFAVGELAPIGVPIPITSFQLLGFKWFDPTGRPIGPKSQPTAILPDVGRCDWTWSAALGAPVLAPALASAPPPTPHDPDEHADCLVHECKHGPGADYCSCDILACPALGHEQPPAQICDCTRPTDRRCVPGTPESQQEACGSACTNVSVDPQNCGSCGNDCAGDICSNGRCIACASGQRCGDTNSCCAAGDCVGGECQTPCPATEQRCSDGQCHQVSSDPGACGVLCLACTTGQVCASGVCAAPCSDGSARCGDGTCCPASACVNGACQPAWRTAAPMLSTAQGAFSATLLLSGKVLVAGGTDGHCLKTTVLYDPATGIWDTGPDLHAARCSHTATLLSSGDVLIAGGGSDTIGALNTAEIYDATANTWRTTGNLTDARIAHTATLLASGRVLIAGGANNAFPFQIATSEEYDPQTGTWTQIGAMAAQRMNHSAALLQSGLVLVAGGENQSGDLSSAELYDPVPRSWSSTGSMGFMRRLFPATILSSGKALVAGGVFSQSAVLNRSEVYNPALGAWSAVASMITPRFTPTGTSLVDGRFLVTGGNEANGIGVVSTAETYDPDTDSWSFAGCMSVRRSQHRAVLLPSGEVLVLGGTTVDLFNPGATTGLCH
jgi:hypothetical protein